MRTLVVKASFLLLLPALAGPAMAESVAAASGGSTSDPWSGMRLAQHSGPQVIPARRHLDARPAPRGSYATHGQRTPAGRPDFAGPPPQVHQQPGALGGGFIEFLFTGRNSNPHYNQPHALPRPSHSRPHQEMRPQYDTRRQYDLSRPHDLDPYAPSYARPLIQARRGAPDAGAYSPPRRTIDPLYLPQTVAYHGDEAPGTIVIDTQDKFLYLVLEDGKAKRYGVGVGREGFGWNGVEKISAKREWPDWRPPEAMRERQPELPAFMPGGPENPLGARAIYLGDTLYRIHGSNEPWTIGQAVSSGCFRMRNEDVIDLYERVKIGATVKVI